jgi:DNA-binding transcriptional ArsR family regulator
MVTDVFVAKSTAMDNSDIDLLKVSASDATRFLKGLANRNRLLILCHLSEGEKSVGELEHAIGLRQPTLSQQLARLRSGGLVRARRNSKSIYYSIADTDVRGVLEVLYGKFCAPRTRRPRARMRARP